MVKSRSKRKREWEALREFLREQAQSLRDELAEMRRDVYLEERKERERERNKPKPIKPLTEQGEKMAEIVENIAWESEKCGYNPEKHANWDILPMEMRAECIKRMDFKTRIQLGRTSELEQSLVATRKSYFNKFLIETKGYYDRYDQCLETAISLELVKPDPLSPGGMERSELNGENLSIHEMKSLKNCEFGEIQCFGFGTHPSSTHDLRRCAPFRFKSLKSKGGNLHMAKFLLLYSAAGVENIELNIKFEKDFSVEQIFGLQSFIKAKRVVIEYMSFEDLLEEAKKLAEKWSEHDVEIGTKCHFNTGSTKELVTGGSRDKMTISMKNESKIVSIIVNTNLQLRQGDVEAYVVQKPKELEK